MTLKKQVEKILEDYPDTRNSDISLTIEVWKQYYPQRIKTGQGGEQGIWLSDLYDLPREDNIKRVRAHFNAKGKYWPTDIKVALGRGIKEDEWRKQLGYPVKSQTYYPTKTESYTDKARMVVCSCGFYMKPTLDPLMLRCPGPKCGRVEKI